MKKFLFKNKLTSGICRHESSKVVGEQLTPRDNGKGQVGILDVSTGEQSCTEMSYVWQR